MEIQEQIKLRFSGVDFQSVQFASTKQYNNEEDKDLSPIKIEISPTAFIPKGISNMFSIIMYVDIEAQGYFNLTISAIGNFELDKEDISDDVRKSFINANSTAIMFPYVRAFISMFTSNLGGVMNRILLPTRFFKGDLEVIYEPDDIESMESPEAAESSE